MKYPTSFRISGVVVVVFMMTTYFAQAGNYTWTGNSDHAWNKTTNWSPAGIPSTNDTVTVSSSSANEITLDGNRTINRLVISANSIDLNSYELQVSTRASFNGGQIHNGNLKVRGTYAYFQGTDFNCTLDVVAGQIKFSGGTFDQTGTFEQNGSASGWGAGGCTFNADVTIKNTGTAYLRLGQDNGDTFNGKVKFYSTGGYALQVAYGDTSYFNDTLFINSSGSGGINFSTGEGGRAQLSSRGCIVTGSTGISAGTLQLKNMAQDSSSGNALTCTGAVTFNVIGCTFTGKVNFSAPSIVVKNAVFNDSTTLTKTGSSYNNTWDGGNTYNGVVTIANTNAATAYLRLATQSIDQYNEDVYFNAGTGAIQPAFSGVNTFKGNVSINGSKVVMNASGNSSTIKCNGTQVQIIGGSYAYSFNKFTIDNVAGITFSRSVSIDSTLTFISGIITSDSTITIKASATVTGASNLSFVDGPVKKIGNTAFVFPVGDENTFFPLGISAPSVASDAFLSRYYFQPQQIGDSLDTTLTSISKCNYWKLERITGTSNVNVKLFWDSLGCGLYDTSGIKMGYWDGAKWRNANATVSGNELLGSIESNSSPGQYSYFTIGYNFRPILVSATLKAGTLHDLPEDLFGFNGGNTIKRDDNNVSNQTWDHLFTQSPPVLAGKPETLIRVPAGTLSNYVDWRTGWPIDERDLPAGWFYTQNIFKNLPIDLSGNEYTNVRDNLQLIAARPIVSWNILTSSYNFEVASIYRLNELNLPTRYIELGEEFYLNDESYKLGFPSIVDYMNKAKAWANDFKILQLPQTYNNSFNIIDPKIAVAGSDYNPNFPGRRKLWLENTIAQLDPSDAIDAITIHDYITNIFSGSSCSIQSNSKLKRHFVTAFKEEDKIKENTFNKITDANAGKFSSKPLEIWLTEYNMFDYENSYIGTWAHGLFNAIMTLKYLETPEITKIVSHTMTSDAVFGNIFESSTSFDDLKCHGVLPNGSTSRQWEFTALGSALNQIALAMHNSTSCQQIEFDNSVQPILTSSPEYLQLYGWVFNSPKGREAIILNLGSPQEEYTINISNLFPGISISNIRFEQLSSFSVDHAILGNAAAVIGLNELTTNAIGGVAPNVPSSGVVLFPGLTITRIRFDNGEILARLTDNEICAGSSTTIVVEPGATTPPVSLSSVISITPTSTDNVFEITTTSPILTTTDFTIAPCSTCTTNLLTLRVHPDLSNLAISVSGGSLSIGDNYTCSTANPITLTASFSISSNSGSNNTSSNSFLWTPDSGLTNSSNGVFSSSIEVRPDRTTNYTVYVTDGFCFHSLSQQIVVPVARVDLGDDIIICDNSSARIFANGDFISNVNYEWKADGTILSNTQDHYFTPALTQTTTYTVTVTDVGTGCSQSDEVVVNTVNCCGDPQTDVCIQPKGNKNRCTINDLIDQLNEVPAAFIISPGQSGNGWTVISLGSPTIKINGGLIQDGAVNNFECYGCSFEFGEKAYWKLENKTSANFHSCTFNACSGKMWDGFIVDTEGSFYAPEIKMDDCELKQAEIGVALARDATFAFQSCLFEDCYTDLSFYRYKQAINVNNVAVNSFSIFNCDFSRSNSSLLFPHATDVKRSAIRLEEVENLVIGDISGNAANQNTLSKSIYGIESYNSSFELYNNVFQDIWDNASNPTNGHCVWNISDFDCNDRKLIIGNGTIGASNLFKRSYSGLYSYGEMNANISMNTFGSISQLGDRLRQFGLQFMRPGKKVLNIYDENNFFDYVYGIWLENDKEYLDLSISNNTFHNGFVNNQKYSGSAITTLNITPALGKNILISNNTIGENSGAGDGQPRIGIRTSRLVGPTIIGNTIYFHLLGTLSNTYSGMIIQDCDEAHIINNTINNLGGFEPEYFYNYLKGIVVQQSQSTCVESNKLYNLGYGMEITGFSTIYSLYNNEFAEFDTAIHLLAANIGSSVGGSGISLGVFMNNQWSSNTYNSSNCIEGSLMNTGQNIDWYLPNGYSNDVSPNSSTLVNNIFTILLSNYTITSTCPVEINDGDPPLESSARNLNYGYITGDSARYIDDFSAQFDYLAKQQLQLLLKRTPSLLNLDDPADDSFQAFYDNFSSSNINLLDSIEQLINLGQMNEANEILANLVDTNDVEYFYKQVYTVYLTHLLSHDTAYSGSDSSLLFEAAYLNPLIYGKSVFTARNILNLEIEDELYSGSKIIYAENQVPNKTEFTVYPVPATDYLNIEWNGLPEECHFLLYDLAGRVYLEQVLNTKIVVKQLMPGMYFIKPLCDKQLKPSKFIKL